MEEKEKNTEEMVVEPEMDPIKEVEKLRKENLKLRRDIRKGKKLLATIIHDLKNPMNSIIGFSNLAISGEHSIEKCLNNVLKASNNVMFLIERIGEILEIENNGPFHPETISLAKFLHDTKKNLQVEADFAGVSLGIERDMCPYEVFADKPMLATLLRNLITNAIRFTPKGGSIKIGCVALQNGKTAYFIKDTGVGMDAQTLADLWKEKDVRRVDVNGRKSTGLGLPICREIVHSHKGEIWCESAPNHGTTFFFTLGLTEEDLIE